ncbi:MAG: 1-deoxy-D-xylulose-5-phosphate synthase [Clostridiales bacterium]|jgi:1-deoxy-D-xylulose-5-phosphate synthase|nr:1-deoxy-D-xylulose-5-phosphate synthase [Clostridiales bacterium]
MEGVNSPDDLRRMNLTRLRRLADETRRFLIESVALTGGHLASNLGVVELTIALHYCYNSPTDKIIWDVGHQTYTHKILTGRRALFSTLRKKGGLSGYPKPDESPHDCFQTGHSGTSVSAALGMALSRDIEGEKNCVVAVIGDGAMTGGLPFEALNNAGRSNTDMLVILNDNEMSISKNVGAISRRLSEIRAEPAYIGAKSVARKMLNCLPIIGKPTGRAIERMKDAIRYALIPGGVFEEFGFKYVGPIDGHNMGALIRTLKNVKKLNGPVLLHVHTVKGKGYAPAEARPERFHSVSAFNADTGEPLRKERGGVTYSEAFGAAMIDLARKNTKIAAITAAMSEGTGLSEFQKVFPERMFDVGIAESHAVTFAAGMAKNGFIPFVAIYSTFLQRAYDQILHDVCLQNLPVTLAIDRAGAVGRDGETHQGLFDLAYLSHMPNMTVMAPKNCEELKKMLEFALTLGSPVAIRYPRGSLGVDLESAEIRLGESEKITDGADALLIFLGSMADVALQARDILKADGVETALVNARFVKPVDDNMVKMIGGYKRSYVIEEAVFAGGLAAAVIARAVELGVDVKGLRSLSFPDEFVAHGSRDEILKDHALDAKSVAERIKRENG